MEALHYSNEETRHVTEFSLTFIVLPKMHCKWSLPSLAGLILRGRRTPATVATISVPFPQTGKLFPLLFFLLSHAHSLRLNLVMTPPRCFP